MVPFCDLGRGSRRDFPRNSQKRMERWKCTDLNQLCQSQYKGLWCHLEMVHGITEHQWDVAQSAFRGQCSAKNRMSIMYPNHCTISTMPYNLFFTSWEMFLNVDVISRRKNFILYQIFSYIRILFTTLRLFRGFF